MRSLHEDRADVPVGNLIWARLSHGFREPTNARLSQESFTEKHFGIPHIFPELHDPDNRYHSSAKEYSAFHEGGRMSQSKTVKRGVAVAALLLTMSTGCVQPWVAQRIEQKYDHKNDFRTPLLPPIRDGFPEPKCEDPPSDNEVLRSLPPKIRGVPYIYEEFHDDITIVKNRIIDKIDPPRFFPLVGMAQLHHCHWECGVYYNETIQSSYPNPVYIKKAKVEVVYIDKDHLHLYVGPNTDTQKDVLLEMTKWN